MNNTDETLVCLKCQNEIDLIDDEIPNDTLELSSPILNDLRIVMNGVW